MRKCCRISADFLSAHSRLVQHRKEEGEKVLQLFYTSLRFSLLLWAILWVQISYGMKGKIMPNRQATHFAIALDRLGRRILTQLESAPDTIGDWRPSTRHY